MGIVTPRNPRKSHTGWAIDPKKVSIRNEIEMSHALTEGDKGREPMSNKASNRISFDNAGEKQAPGSEQAQAQMRHVGFASQRRVQRCTARGDRRMPDDTSLSTCRREALKIRMRGCLVAH